MSFYGFQMQRTLGGTIPGTSTTGATEADRRISFNDGIIDGSTIITHDSGLITINSSGNYFVSWFITIKTGLGDSGALFSLIAKHYLSASPDTSIDTKDYPSTNSMKTGQLSGSAIIQIQEGQICKLGLYNEGEYEAILATNSAVQANIAIHPFVVGTYSSSYGLVGMTLKLDNTTSSELAYNAPVIFNSSSIPTTAANIFGYSTTDGKITIKTGGNFMVNWSINIDGSQDAQAITFSLMSVATDGTTTPVATFDSTLIMQHTYSGFAFITATTNEVFQLVNTSSKPNTQGGGVQGAALTYSNIPTRAILRIVGHS